MSLAEQRCRHSQGEEDEQKQEYEKVRNKAGTALMLPRLADRLDMRPPTYQIHSRAGWWMESEGSPGALLGNLVSGMHD